MIELGSPNAVDIVAAVIIVAGSLNGLRRGLSREVAGLVSALLSLFLGFAFYRPFGAFITEHTRLSERPAFALTFVLTVLAVIVVMIILRVVLKEAIVFAVNDKGVERVGGLLAGFVKSAVFVCIAILAINMWEHDYMNRVCGSDSMIGRGLAKTMPHLREGARTIEAGIKEMESRLPD
jgi:uncharacterized membrane protein required for colicin V production